VDPTPDTSDFEQMEWAQDSFFTELASSIPGIDEAMSFAEVLKQVRSAQLCSAQRQMYCSRLQLATSAPGVERSAKPCYAQCQMYCKEDVAGEV
jgi:hypothetical protein